MKKPKFKTFLNPFLSELHFTKLEAIIIFYFIIFSLHFIIFNIFDDTNLHFSQNYLLHLSPGIKKSGTDCIDSKLPGENQATISAYTECCKEANKANDSNSTSTTRSPLISYELTTPRVDEITIFDDEITVASDEFTSGITQFPDRIYKYGKGREITSQLRNYKCLFQ